MGELDLHVRCKMHIPCIFGPVPQNVYWVVTCTKLWMSKMAKWPWICRSSSTKFNQIWSIVRCIFCVNLVQIPAKMFELSCYNCEIVKILSPEWPYDLENIGQGHPNFNQVWNVQEPSRPQTTTPAGRTRWIQYTPLPTTLGGGIIREDYHKINTLATKASSTHWPTRQVPALLVTMTTSVIVN